jgi:hypothetical protein
MYQGENEYKTISGDEYMPPTDSMKINNKAFLARLKQRQKQDTSKIPESEWNMIVQGISIYFGEDKWRWIKHLKGQSVIVVKETFEWVKALPYPKKNQARIMTDQFSKKGGEKK